MCSCTQDGSKRMETVGWAVVSADHLIRICLTGIRSVFIANLTTITVALKLIHGYQMKKFLELTDSLRSLSTS